MKQQVLLFIIYKYFAKISENLKKRFLAPFQQLPHPAQSFQGNGMAVLWKIVRQW